MNAAAVNLERWRALLNNQSPMSGGLLYLWTAAFAPEVFDQPLLDRLCEFYADAPSPTLEYTLALLSHTKFPLKAPPFHAHMAFLTHRIGFNAKMLEALTQKPSTTAILLFALSSGAAEQKVEWLRRWLTSLPAKSPRATIVRALVNGSPISNPFQPLHLEAMASAWLAAMSASEMAGGSDSALSAETVLKRMQAHPITKPWIRLRPASGQAQAGGRVPAIQ